MEVVISLILIAVFFRPLLWLCSLLGAIGFGALGCLLSAYGEPSAQYAFVLAAICGGVYMLVNAAYNND